MIRWLVYLIPHFAIIIARYPLALFAVAFCTTSDGRNLRAMRWLGTIDNDLTGDSGWRAEHLYGTDPLTYINRVRWLWRNGGNWLNYRTLGYIDSPLWREIYAAQPGITYIKRDDGAWLYRRFIPIGGKYIEIFAGWALFGPQQGLCKIVATVRIRSHTN